MRAFPFPGPEVSDLVTREEMEVPALVAGQLPIPVRVQAPVGQSVRLPGVVAIHGGCYVMGNRAMDDGVFDRRYLDLGMVGVSVGYRRARETPNPGALEDCYRALQWTVANADTLGFDPSRMGVFGASAGGAWPSD